MPYMSRKLLETVLEREEECKFMRYKSYDDGQDVSVDDLKERTIRARYTLMIQKRKNYTGSSLLYPSSGTTIIIIINNSYFSSTSK